MLVECDRVLAMVPGDRSGKLAAVPLVTSAAAAQQPQVVVISVVSAAAQQPQVVVISVVSAAAQQPQVVATRKGLI
jgi:hypothetical protein